MSDAAPHRVVIVGSGFGGLFASKALRRAPVHVTLIDRVNHHLFQPLLYQVATGILSEGQIAPATREIFRNYPNMEIVLAEVESIDPVGRMVATTSFGESKTFPYDSLIVAAGVTPSYFGSAEFRERSMPMKSLSDALALREQIYGSFELAELEEDEAKRRALMTFVIVGGGPTGVEMAGQLRELSRRALRRNYRNIDPAKTRVVIAEGGDRLIAEMGERVSHITLHDMSKMGVEVHLNTKVTDLGDGWAELLLPDGTSEKIQSATIVWAAGMRGAPIGEQLAQATGAKLDKGGRVLVEPDCSVPGYPEIFVVGDLMGLGDLPGVAETAIQSGAHAAHVIRRRVKGDDKARDFHYRDLGNLAAISRFKAVAKIGPVSVGGLVGWLLWLVVHITFLTGFKNRVGALARWAVSFVGRGRSERALTGRMRLPS